MQLTVMSETYANANKTITTNHNNYAYNWDNSKEIKLLLKDFETIEESQNYEKDYYRGMSNKNLH